MPGALSAASYLNINCACAEPSPTRVVTRHPYLHLDNEADAWESLDRGRYRRMRHSDAIEQVFTPGWFMHHAEGDEREALEQALAATWERGNGDKAAGGHILPSSPACAFRRLP